jgi:hypothetical protein
MEQISKQQALSAKALEMKQAAQDERSTAQRPRGGIANFTAVLDARDQFLTRAEAAKYLRNRCQHLSAGSVSARGRALFCAGNCASTR